MKLILLAGLGIALAILAGSSLSAGFGSARPVSVYTIDNMASNSVLQYRSSSAGALTLAGTFATHGSGTGARLASQGALTLTEDGDWLIAVDAGSNQITAFQVNNNGSLTFASIVGSEGTAPISVTTHGDLVYVLDNGTASTPGNIAGFTLSSRGQLTFIPGSIQPLSGKTNSSPEQIGFSPNGAVLVVTEKAAGVIDSYTVGATAVPGSPLVTPSNSAGPYGFAFTPQGYLILSEAGTGTLSSYSISGSGVLTTLSGSLPDFGLAPCWVAVSPNGQFAYADNAHGGTISGYVIGQTGTMSLFSSVAAHTAIPNLDLAFGGSYQSEFLYVLNGNSITSFAAHSDGSISQVSSTGGLPASATGLAATQS
jgi:DNA-binding beta-propeller fold protein YncE